MPALPVIEVKDVRKTFAQRGAWPWSEKTEVHAVNGVTLTVHQGDVIALVGQSGSGKTTLSRIILGLEEPTSGEIWINQQRWDGLKETQRRELRPNYQYIPQDAMSALNPQQTALEHIVETYRVLGELSRADAADKAQALLTTLGLLYDEAGHFFCRAKIVFIISNLMVGTLHGTILHDAPHRWDLQLAWWCIYLKTITHLIQDDSTEGVICTISISKDIMFT